MIDLHIVSACFRNSLGEELAIGTLLSGSLAVEAVFLPAERPDRDSLFRQREDRAGLGDAAQDVLAKGDQCRCSLGGDCP